MAGGGDCAGGVQERCLDQYNYQDLSSIRKSPNRGALNLQDCFTHSSFFHVPLRLRLPARLLPSLCLLAMRGESSPSELLMRKSFSLGTAGDCLRGGEP